MQINELVQVDLLEEVKESLLANRLGEVFRIAVEGKLSPRIREVFQGMAELVAGKQRELERAGQLNRFYRTCLERVLEGEQISPYMDEEYSNISHSCRELLLDLQTHMTSLSNRSEKGVILGQRVQEMEERLDFLRKGEEEATSALQNLKMKMEAERNRTEQIMNSLRNEVEVVQEISNQKLANLQKNLDARNATITELQNKNKQLLRKHQQIERQMRFKAEFSDSISLQSKRLSQILQQKDEQIYALQNQNKMLQSSTKQLEMSFSLQASIIMSINNQHELPVPLSQALRKAMGSEVCGVDRLYSFKQQHAHNFHQSIDNKQNILIVCLTANEELIGAFTSSSFKLDSSISELSAKAFLFGIIDEEITVNQLKSGRESVIYDYDYLIFGNEQLCIQKGSRFVTSQFPTAVESQLHYRRLKYEDNFLRAVGKEGRVQLKNYQIFQVQFQP